MPPMLPMGGEQDPRLSGVGGIGGVQNGPQKPGDPQFHNVGGLGGQQGPGNAGGPAPVEGGRNVEGIGGIHSGLPLDNIRDLDDVSDDAMTLPLSSRILTLYVGFSFHAALAKDSLYLPISSGRR